MDDDLVIEYLKEMYHLFNKWNKVDNTVDDYIEPDYETLKAIDKVLSMIMTDNQYWNWRLVEGKVAECSQNGRA